jgi:hypothetical protein
MQLCYMIPNLMNLMLVVKFGGRFTFEMRVMAGFSVSDSCSLLCHQALPLP